ncbi:hypothetical protein ACIQVK_18065 [Streptomyces sp. NPDC090493]|uniref:hypothetical protein n=1 Tax=Streptomyces sp. NPDC090493 TaxID=3365964 RepID=UPI0038063618
MAELHGFTLVDLWLSPRFGAPRKTEASLLCDLRLLPNARQRRREYFYNLPFEQAVEVAQSLSHWKMDGIPSGAPSPLPSQTSARRKLPKEVSDLYRTDAQGQNTPECGQL